MIYGVCITEKYELEGLMSKEHIKRIKEMFDNHPDLSYVVLEIEGTMYLIKRIKNTTTYEIANAYSNLVRLLNKEFGKDIAVIIDNIRFDVNMIYEFVLLSTYRFRNNKRDTINLKLVDVNLQEYKNEEVEAIVDSVFKARDLINMSVDSKSPKIIAEKIKEDLESVRNKHLNVKILEGEDLRKEGLELIYGVGKGSDKQPVLLIIEYITNRDKPTKAIVGKGVVFDAGGYNIKLKMIEDMKLDVSGGVVSAYVIHALAKMNIETNIIAAIPLVENLISGRSYKPGDVIKSFSGKWVEIINTDAEGRLILADALSYVQHKYEVKEIIDVATLTGACMIALGKDVAGIMGDEDIAQKIQRIGMELEERFWMLPLWDEYYKSMLESKVADVKNLPSEPWAGAIVGGMFLKHFINKGVRWVHIDIAGPSYTKTPKLFYYAGSTAFGLRTLYRYFKEVA